MRKEYQDRVKEYCKSNKMTVRHFCRIIGIPFVSFVPSYQKRGISLITLILLEPYIGDMREFKIDIMHRMKSLIYDFNYQYLDRDLISIDDYYKIYQIYRPYILKQFELKRKRSVNGN